MMISPCPSNFLFEGAEIDHAGATFCMMDDAKAPAILEPHTQKGRFWLEKKLAVEINAREKNRV
jgi:hypothetical protein